MGDRQKARSSKYASEIEQIRVITTNRSIANPQLRLYRMGIIHCLEGIDEHWDDVDLEEEDARLHKIVRLLNEERRDDSDMELSNSEEDSDRSSNNNNRSSETSSSEDESQPRKGEKSKKSSSKGKGKGKGKSSRK